MVAADGAVMSSSTAAGLEPRMSNPWRTAMMIATGWFVAIAFFRSVALPAWFAPMNSVE